MAQSTLTHIAGTFVIQANGSFLNGAGLGQGEDRTTTVPKLLRDGNNTVPYVSSQAWKRWLRNTAVEEAGWSPSELRAIAWNAKGNTSKISGELDPVLFPEDDIFGYMRAERGSEQEADEESEGESESEESGETPAAKRSKVKPVVRASPFSASLLLSIRKTGWHGRDEGYVHLKEGTPLPYTTQFYTTNMQAVFCLDYSRLGVFRNIGDRIELAEEFVQPHLADGKLIIKQDFDKKGKVYEVTDKSARKERASALLKALSVLRGGAKQAQFGTDVAPKVLIAAGLICGNPIFNHLFEDDKQDLRLKVNVLSEVIADYADRIVTPVYIGLRTGYLANEPEVHALASDGRDSKVVICTPREAAQKLAEQLQ